MSKALIIDDEQQMRRLLRMLLESRGYEVCEAEEGQRGLQEAAFHRPEVVLLALGLPGLGGLEVLKRLREWSPVPVLILSVRDQESMKLAAFDAGADDYVTKPFSTAELLAYRTRAPAAVEQHPTDEHLLPIYVALGAAGEGAKAHRLHSSVEFAALRMDAYEFAA